MSDAADGDPTSESDDDAHDELLISLADDFAARHRRGEHPTIEEYVQQHPHLAAEIRDLFPAMALMEEPGLSPLADVVPASERPGAVVGRYKLLERLGEGGFGVVFLAEQQHPVRRKVALKVIKPGLDTQQVIARFQAERQALAMMDHENIARVLDAGATDSGRPYFVMELVHGIPITDYCDRNKATPEQRLKLFVQVCRAVQHAHTKGIIHRDLKPTNVLVAVHDGVPVPKVIDFGVAKATGLQQLADGTLFTNVAQIIGTPLYMSPEQADMTGHDVDTRSDVYSLGVVLYELLTGTTPVDKDRLKRAGFDEVRRIIREEEPPRPSTRISTLSGQAPAESAGRRGELKKLGQLVRGELDWIVMKALEKDRNRRYETASGLAADVERYLKGEAVQACPPSATYRAHKLLRRHKGPVIAVCLVALALVGGIIGTTWGMLQARDQHYLALLSQARAERVSGRPGQRFDAVNTLKKAARIRVTPELRQEAAAALLLPDIALAQEWDDTDPTGELAFSFDGTEFRYARVSQQGAVTLCRVVGGKEKVDTDLAPLGHSTIRGPWWSNDRRFLAYGHSGVDNTEAAALRVWKVDGPAATVVVDDPAGVYVSAFAFQGGADKCAVAHVAGDVTVYDLDTGKGKRLPVGMVEALAFHPSDGRLAIAWGNSVRILDSNTGVILKTLRLDQLKSTESIRCIAWHPDGRRIAMGCRDRKIHLYDVDADTEILPPWEGSQTFEMIAFNHAGDGLLSRDWTEQSGLWDVATGRYLLTTPRLLSRWSTFSPDDQFVGFSRDRGKIQLWRLAWGREMRGLRRAGPDEGVDAVELDGSGRILAVAAPERLSFYGIATGEELASVSVPYKAARPFGFDPAGGWFTGGTRGAMLWPLRHDAARPELVRVGPPQMLASGDGTQVGGGPITSDRFTVGGLKVWPARTDPGQAGLLPASPQPLVAGFGSYLWGFSGSSGDGQVVALSDHSATILIHRNRAGPPLVLGPQVGVRGAHVSPDGKWVATCSGHPDDKSKLVQIWDGDGSHVKDLPLSGDYAWGRFSPDSKWLATFTEAGPRLWKVGSWTEPVQSFATGGIVFSPDTKLMAVNDVVGGVRLLKTASDAEVARVTGPEPLYWPHCFTPDGTKLIASGRATYVWDLRLIRQELSAMGLEWDLPPFPPEALNARARLHLTIDTGTPAQAVSGSAFRSPRARTPGLDRAK